MAGGDGKQGDGSWTAAPNFKQEAVFASELHSCCCCFAFLFLPPEICQQDESLLQMLPRVFLPWVA